MKLIPIIYSSLVITPTLLASTLDLPPEKKLRGEALVIAASDFIARGIYLGSNSLQNSLTLDYLTKPVKLKASARYVAITDSSTGNNEFDAIFEASTRVKGVDLTAGYLYFDFQDTDASAHELYGTIAKKWEPGYELSFTYSGVVEGVDNDGYSTIKGTKLFKVFDNILKTELWAAYLFERREFSHMTAKARYDYKFMENAYLQPFIAYTWELDGLAYFGSALPSNQKNRLFGGLGVSIKF